MFFYCIHVRGDTELPVWPGCLCVWCSDDLKIGEKLVLSALTVENRTQGYRRTIIICFRKVIRETSGWQVSVCSPVGEGGMKRHSKQD